MKYTVPVLLIFFALVISVNAQPGVDRVLPGVNFNYWQDSEKNMSEDQKFKYSGKRLSFSGLLHGGYFIGENFVLGLMAGTMFSKVDHTENGPGYIKLTGYDKSVFVGGLFSRWYTELVEDRASFFLHTAARGEKGEAWLNERHSFDGVHFSTESSAESIRGFRLMLQPGFTWFVTKKTGIEILFSNIVFYYEQTTGPHTTASSGGLSVQADLPTLFVGLSFYL